MRSLSLVIRHHSLANTHTQVTHAASPNFTGRSLVYIPDNITSIVMEKAVSAVYRRGLPPL